MEDETKNPEETSEPTAAALPTPEEQGASYERLLERRRGLEERILKHNEVLRPMMEELDAINAELRAVLTPQGALWLDRYIRWERLPERIRGTLRRYEMAPDRTLTYYRDFLELDEYDLYALQGFGEVAIRHVREHLESIGLFLRPKIPMRVLVPEAVVKQPRKPRKQRASYDPARIDLHDRYKEAYNPLWDIPPRLR